MRAAVHAVCGGVVKVGVKLVKFGEVSGQSRVGKAIKREREGR